MLNNRRFYSSFENVLCLETMWDLLGFYMSTFLCAWQLFCIQNVHNFLMERKKRKTNYAKLTQVDVWICADIQEDFGIHVKDKTYLLDCLGEVTTWTYLLQWSKWNIV